MKLKEARKLGIDYCKNNKCNYTYISANNMGGFYLSSTGDDHTVFLVNKNGSLDTYLGTNYAANFHKEFKKKNSNRRNDNKRKLADASNYDFLNYDLDEDEEEE